MPPGKEANFPFILRDMLDYNGASSFSLIVDTWSNSTSTIRVTALSKSDAFIQQIIADGLRTVQTTTLGLSEIPIMVTVDTLDSAIIRGQIYAKVSLAINGVRHATLCSGYVGNGKTISYPQDANEDSSSGIGYLNQYAGTNPAANVEVNETLNGGVYTRVQSIAATLVTDANAANRLVGLTLENGTGTIATFYAPAVQTANQTIKYVWGIGLPTQVAIAGTEMTIALPSELRIPPTADFLTVTSNRQVGDNWGAPAITIEEWLTSSY